MHILWEYSPKFQSSEAIIHGPLLSAEFKASREKGWPLTAWYRGSLPASYQATNVGAASEAIIHGLRTLSYVLKGWSPFLWKIHIENVSPRHATNGDKQTILSLGFHSHPENLHTSYLATNVGAVSEVIIHGLRTLGRVLKVWSPWE